jgi:hypothetical protein
MRKEKLKAEGKKTKVGNKYSSKNVDRRKRNKARKLFSILVSLFFLYFGKKNSQARISASCLTFVKINTQTCSLNWCFYECETWYEINIILRW